ncbi:MAG TPA: hypothetical protein VH561_03990 [Micromonosporaceae bacterium]|jgi:hypothetical protein
MRVVSGIAALVTILVVTTGCTTHATPEPGPVILDWREVTLPDAPAGERNAPRAAAVCADGRVYVVGAYVRADGSTSPAAWTSPDLQSWATVPVSASTFYGVQHELYGATCRDGTLVALGAKPGGAHGNPRISSYRTVGAGGAAAALTEVPAPFESFGGADAVNVGRVSSGPPGFLISGNRRTGAAVWLSPDGGGFDIVEAAPVLSTGTGPVTWAQDAAWTDGAWVVVGATAASPLHRDAASWRSSDGRTWATLAAQNGPGYDEMDVVTPHADTLIALGQNDATFQAWRLDPGGWVMTGRFGSTRADDGRIPSLAGLASSGDTLLAAVTFTGISGDDTGTVGVPVLWRSTDGGASWSPVAAPPGTDTGRQRGDAVVGTAGGFLAVVDDGTTERVFVTTGPPA